MLPQGNIGAWGGDMVLCARPPIETLAIRPRATRLAAAVESILFAHLMPWPDAILLLDAPGQVLYSRKHEHTPELLERLRRRYAELFDARGTTVISTEEPLERSVAQASAAVWRAPQARPPRAGFMLSRSF